MELIVPSSFYRVDTGLHAQAIVAVKNDGMSARNSYIT
jgi:hypothetical protein